jgi:membrane-associated phospholipid phosphatase
MSERTRDGWILAAPIIAAALALVLWRVFGFEALNELELPLAAAINGLTGRWESFDRLVMFFNHWWGEALCVLTIFTVYAVTAAWLDAHPTDWRRIAGFAAFIFAVWIVANATGDRLEPVFARPSPSHFIGESFVNLEERYGVEVKTESMTSFPSNHGSVFFTVLFMSVYRWGRGAWVLLPLAVVLSMPRVFTGAHWASDTLIGSVLVTWLVATLAMRTPMYAAYRWVEDCGCDVWERVAARWSRPERDPNEFGGA